MNDDVDLRRYIDVLVRRWKVVASITLVAVVIAAAVTFTSPASYEARASVLVVTTRAQVILEPKYLTLETEELKALREALVVLAKSNSVATAAIEELGDQITPKERRVSSLTGKVGVTADGDLINIVVKTHDRIKSAAIANAWADSYASYINRLYTGTSQSPEAMRAQAREAKAEYEEQQRAWEQFVVNNTIHQLDRRIGDIELLVNLKSLRDGVEAGSSSPTSAMADGLAIVVLEQQAFAPDLRADIQLSLNSLSGLSSDPKDQLRDVDGLIVTLESRSDIEHGQSLAQLDDLTMRLRQEREAEAARERALHRAREVTWSAFETLDNKAVELAVAAQAQDVAAKLAFPAVVPEQAAGSGKVMPLGTALVLGATVGVFGAFAVEYFRTSYSRKEPEDGGSAAEGEDACNVDR